MTFNKDAGEAAMRSWLLSVALAVVLWLLGLTPLLFWQGLIGSAAACFLLYMFLSREGRS